MFKISTAHSLTAKPTTAAVALADQALRDLGGQIPRAALLFSTFGRNHTELLCELKRILPDCPIVGGSSNGEVSRTQGYRVSSSLLILFASDSISIRAGVLRNLAFEDEAYNMESATQQLQQQGFITASSNLAESKARPVLGLLFPDGIGLDGESVVRLFVSQFPGTRFFGGATAENFTMASTEQFFNEEVLHNAVPFLLLSGPLRYQWAVTQGLSSGWHAVGERLNAECDGKWIKTIASRPAIDYLASRYRLQGGQLSVCHPFVIYPEREKNDHYFRDVVRYSEDTGALESIQLLPSECQIQLTEPDPAAILAVSRQNILSALAHFPGAYTPAGVLWFSCISRALVLDSDAASEFSTATDMIESTLPIAGFYTYGEIAPGGPQNISTYHSSTLVTLLLGEEPKTDLGIFGQTKQFLIDNLKKDNLALTQALAESQAKVNNLQNELGLLQALERIGGHSKTELNALLRTLALKLVCDVLNTRFADFKRLALKGDPPVLNRTGLARLVNDMHQKQLGKPFPLTLKQLTHILTDFGDANKLY
ncbi:FIST signal transduction protein [Candidatus Symbiobacter mobilis]|uniref:FIST domain-containing protein n=1 Tax=Candidatus Symbiobacter mobilis CR TaxID=946483 RepID=U5NE00_9BURK|nr:FIST N-terminal domain-containing protein [Candidatus Symbiobacter mobilis]AGX88349.1 hypothetical protein Cenrod_2287 [Candidatus Symbiobacter mobilis CR]